MKKIKIDWNSFDIMADRIVERYKDRDIEKIVGISRGGLTLATVLSNRLNIPMVPLEWQTRDGFFRDVVKVINITNFHDVSKILFVDDICDSGTTIREINVLVSEARWCTLFSKGNEEVEFCPTPINNKLAWIVFPWE